jgi:hypothetical protein
MFIPAERRLIKAGTELVFGPIVQIIEVLRVQEGDSSMSSWDIQLILLPVGANLQRTRESLVQLEVDELVGLSCIFELKFN